MLHEPDQRKKGHNSVFKKSVNAFLFGLFYQGIYCISVGMRRDLFLIF